MEPRKNDWLATLFFSPDKSIQDLESIHDYIFCSKCGQKNSVTSKFCIHCGYINYDAPGNEDFRNLVVEKKVKKQVEREKRRKEREARKQRGQGTFIEDSALNQQVVKRKLKIRERLYNLVQRFWKALLTAAV